MQPNKKTISNPVINRLPRYYRYLDNLLVSGVTRISSGGISKIMGLTPSQIRQDFNHFGGFGQQGYGYNVKQLHDEIGKILHLDKKLPTILIGAGNLGNAVACSTLNNENSGFKLIGIFDKNADNIAEINGFPILPMEKLDDFCKENCPEVAVLCTPPQSAKELADKLITLGIDKFWNFTNYDLLVHHPEVIVENVHIKDSLMALSYRANNSER